MEFMGKDKATDKDSHFRMGGFYTEDGRTDWQFVQDREPGILPRAAGCDYGVAYTFNGKGGTPHERETVFVLCDGFFDLPTDQDGRVAIDMRTTEEIMDSTTGGLFGDSVALENISRHSRGILHELFHTRAVGGGKLSLQVSGPKLKMILILLPVDPVTGEPLINDGPYSQTYGFEACKNVGTAHAAVAADCLSYLALALRLQFATKFGKFSWVTGALDVREGAWKYGKYVPPSKG
jgi:hypothetical protein